MTAGSRLALVAADLPQMLAAPLTRGIRVLIGPAPERRADLQTLADWAASGEVIPHVSLTLPLDQAARAHAMAESGRKRGNIMLMP
jgi:NADPH:quinone reductase-like Zn-dependent oxidoreductase